jgi:hypothetical protein
MILMVSSSFSTQTTSTTPMTGSVKFLPGEGPAATVTVEAAQSIEGLVAACA